MNEGQEGHEGQEQGAEEGGRSWRPVDVLLGVIRRVQLDDPVNIRNVQAPG